MVRNKLRWAQMTQWDFKNKGKSGWTGTSSFVLEVPLRHLRPSVIYSVPCDRILQRAYYRLQIRGSGACSSREKLCFQNFKNVILNILAELFRCSHYNSHIQIEIDKA